MSGVVLAIVTMHPDKVAGGAPIFHVESEEEMQQTAFNLEKIMDAMAHDLKNGSMILVKH
ncbi:hypothetical protein NV379_06520 [Paenibacillus sp. N1-5-1-14]|uniref:capping complex subunit for YIEGIA n=1 Tax=Paenibacillus radicibacter TaxID=2972488 RepID=UPI0021594069|nr:hypothetical protein [Paenibacillus radicibacter]MCR8642311.1 hypothetical protein [Paenibacillus radicibacter]